MSVEDPSTSLRVKSVGEMHALASRVAGGLKPGDVLLLEGELGSGKTTFVQGLAKALGVKERVTSPSFTVVSEYEVGGSGGISRLIHVDLYRLDERKVETEVAVKDLFDEGGEKDVVVVEWADKLGESAPEGSKKIEFAHGATEGERVVTL